MRQIVIKKNRYVDSVTLMSIGDKVMKLDGVENAEAQMGTWANCQILSELGYTGLHDAGADDLVLAVCANTKKQVDAALAYMEDILDHRDGQDDEIYQSLDEIDLDERHFDLAQISLPGRYAFAEAEKALDKGLHLFIFSDNVSMEEEKKLKEKGREKNLLVMGPDCGVGMVGGVCLGAGSILSKGSVGIAAASGSGAQEVACLLEKFGLGVSNLIGTGGRDLYPEIGGIEMIQAMEVLEKDADTMVIVLVSKLADEDVMNKVLDRADKLKKPVVAVFLGSGEALFKGHKAIPAFSLKEAAVHTAEILDMGKEVSLEYTDKEIAHIVQREIALYDERQKYFRGLYCGGTFTEEGLIYYSRIPGISLYSNLDTVYAKKLKDAHISEGHTILDMGAEDFTAEAPHPVFDPKLRIRRLEKELDDEETAVVLLDFISGPGVAQDPFTPFIDAINARGGKPHVTYVANICGSKNDPQNIEEKKKLLQDAGVIVTSCSYESARVAGALMEELERRRVK